jgi:hypothetical protein
VSFYSNLNFVDKFSKNTQISNFIKIHQFGAELFHVDGRTDMTKVIVAFRNFANASKSNRDTGRNCGSYLYTLSVYEYLYKLSVYEYFYNAIS